MIGPVAVARAASLHRSLIADGRTSNPQNHPVAGFHSRLLNSQPENAQLAPREVGLNVAVATALEPEHEQTDDEKQAV